MFKIYRRMFNPPEGEKNLKRLVASFQPSAEAEAYRCLAFFQGLSTDFKENPHFSSFRYTIERDPTPVAAPSEGKGIQIDLSKAHATKRPISYAYSQHVESDGSCTCLAYHTRYGSIRGTVEDSPKGRQLFIARIRAVWPNAEITLK